MAVVLRNDDGTYNSTCALCNKLLNDPIFATTHFLGDPSHHLFAYSDAAMHWDCYAKWEHQAEFAELFFNTAINRDRDTTYWRLLGMNSDVQASYGWMPDEVANILRKSGSDIRVPKSNWKSWIEGDYVKTCDHEQERKAVEDVLEFLRTIKIPTDYGIWIRALHNTILRKEGVTLYWIWLTRLRPAVLKRLWRSAN
jgi:hypothetical protein